MFDVSPGFLMNACPSFLAARSVTSSENVPVPALAITVPMALEPEGRGLLGDKATTSLGSDATAAVDAALTAAVFVPSVTFTGQAFATEFAAPWFDVTVPLTGCVAGKLLTLTDPTAFDPDGSGLLGLNATTAEGSATTAAVDAAFTAVVFVPSVSFVGQAPATAAAAPWSEIGPPKALR
jgi:hypothetical protein